MITDEELTQRINDLFESSLLSPVQRDKTLNNITQIIRNATTEQLQSRDYRALIKCLLKILLHYEDLLHADGLCEWKRRRKFKVARDCYHSLLRIYLPEKLKEIVETIVDIIYENQLWKFETFCFEVMCSLLDINSASGALFTHRICDKLLLPEIDVNEARSVLRILCELLEVYKWPDTGETIIAIKRLLELFHTSIIDTQSLATAFSMPLANFKKGLEVCLLNVIKNLPNAKLLIIIQHMCSWTIAEDITDEIVLEFGSTLEYTAYMHQVDLYEESLTPAIFPLLMQMVGSHSRLTSLLGNRVLQFLLDRNNNRMIFDTPRIFFEHTSLDLHITSCLKEDLLFFKLNRELLHDSLLKSLVNHKDAIMNLETTYCTVCLIAIEVPCGFTAAALVCLAMNLQEIIFQLQEDHIELACRTHATIVSIMSLLCWIHKAKVFYNYVNRIVTDRAQWAPHFNPPIQSQYSFALHHTLWSKPELFFVDWETRYGLWKCFRFNQNDIPLTV